jgi:hypothetical protein
MLAAVQRAKAVAPTFIEQTSRASTSAFAGNVVGICSRFALGTGSSPIDGPAGMQYLPLERIRI